MASQVERSLVVFYEKELPMQLPPIRKAVSLPSEGTFVVHSCENASGRHSALFVATVTLPGPCCDPAQDDMSHRT